MKIISQQLERLFISYSNKMFNNVELGRDDEMNYVSTGKLKRIVTYIDRNEPAQYRLTFLEQNPNKQSQYGKRAANGAKIMWVILYNRPARKECWLGRVENGKWYQKNFENNNGLPF